MHRWNRVECTVEYNMVCSPVYAARAMANFLARFSVLPAQSHSVRCWLTAGTACSRRYYSTGGPASGGARRRDLWSMGWIGVGAGAILGTGYALNEHYQSKKVPPIMNIAGGPKPYLLKSLPDIKPSRKIVNPSDTSGLKLTLYQYQTCPFCCKVRAFLDFYGISYDVVEVNPVMKQQIKWSPYKKVPIVVVEDKEGESLSLVDSSTTISALASYLYNPEKKMSEYVSYFPAVKYSDDDGLEKVEVLNRYFLMYGDEPADRTKEDIANERKWRRWVDEVLVHTISPNIYRNVKESLQAFNWFSQTGDWEKLFATWERLLVIYVGATAMYIIGKRLKQRYGLKDDVRRSLYDACNQWIREVTKKGSPFMGGSSPNLADLAVFGVLSSIEGCNTFEDLLEHTKIGDWYHRTKATLGYREGHQLPH